MATYLGIPPGYTFSHLLGWQPPPPPCPCCCPVQFSAVDSLHRDFKPDNAEPSPAPDVPDA